MANAVVAGTHRPVLMNVGMVVSFVGGAVMVIGSLMGAAGMGDFSALRASVLGSWALPAWVIANLVVGIALLVFGFGIRAQRSWTRAWISAFWAILGISNLVFFAVAKKAGSARVVSLFSAVCQLALFAFSVWYFYGKRGVVEYFARIRAA